MLPPKPSASSNSGGGSIQIASLVPAADVSESLKALSKLDDRLCEALARGDIRFLRTAWLKSQPEGYRLQYRQELEALEAPTAAARKQTTALDACRPLVELLRMDQIP